VHRIEVILPPLNGSGVEEIREGCVVRPHLPDKDLTLNLQEYILCDTILILSVVILRKGPGCGTSIYEGDITHALLVKRVDKVRETLVGNLIIVDEVPIVLHVVDV
jgi:hypothetical protein